LNGRNYWVTASTSDASAIQLEAVDSGGKMSGLKASVPIPAVLLIGSPERQFAFSPLAALDGKGSWSLYRLEGSIPRIAAKTDLTKLFSYVASVTVMADLSVVAGSDLQDRPLVCVFDANLKKVRHAVLPRPLRGVVSSIASLHGSLVLAVNATDDAGHAWLWKLSPRLTASSNVELSGNGVLVASRNADLFISYSSDEEVFAQLFDAQFQSKWKTKVLKRAGETTLFFSPIPLSQGFALVGANHGHLTVARLSSTGQLLYSSEDKRGELMPPASGYRIVVDGDQLNILGIAMRRSDTTTANETSFRFQDLP
jgi:hypothetical protein